MNNLGTYFEIPVNNMERAIKFYSHVFNVEFVKEVIHDCEMAFFPFNSEGDGITGGLARGKIYKPSLDGSLVYLSTTSIDKTMTKILQMNGVELFPKTAVADLGFSAEFKDSEGNRVGLFQKI